MMLTVHNPAKRKTKARRSRAEKETAMATTKKKKRKKARRKNPANPANPTKRRRRRARRANPANPKRRRKLRARRNPANPRRRRRRNPSGGGGSTGVAKKLAIGALAAVAGGAVVLAGSAALMARSPSLAQPTMASKVFYGMAAAGFVGGVMLAKKRPEIGAGLAAGSVAAVAVRVIVLRILSAHVGQSGP